MTTRPNKPQRKPMPDPPQIRQLTIEEAPHLYENGVYYPGAVIPGFHPEPLPVAPPTPEQAPHQYEDGIYYPDSDGVPLPDGAEQYHEFIHVNTALQTHFADQPNTTVSGNTFLFYDAGHPHRFVSPDCYVAFDVDTELIRLQNHYRIWIMGKPPDFALEIASSHTAHNDLVPKRELYAIIGIGEYWRYDPSPDSRHYGEPLVGEQLVDGEYRRLPVTRDAQGRPRGYSPALGLDLVWENGELRFYDPVTGQWVKSFQEQRQARIAARAEANAERAAREAAEARADAAQVRAEEAEAEVQRLREQLRRQQEE